MATNEAMRSDRVDIMASPNLDKLRDNLALKKVCSFDDVKTQPGRIVIIRHIKTGDKSQNRPWTSRKNYHDPEENIYYGFPIGVDSKTGEYKWNKMNIDGELVLDLSDKNSCRIYEFWRNSPIFIGSKLNLQNPAETILMVYDEEEEVKHIFKQNESKHQLRSKIANMKEEQIKLYGLVFNVDPTKNDIMRIKNILYERIEKDVDLFKKLDADQNKLRVRAILNQAILNGVVKQDTMSGEISYEGKTLGTNKPTAEMHLEANHGLFNDIYSAIASRAKTFVTDEQMANGKDYGAEIKQLKAELAKKDDVVESLNAKFNQVLELLEKQGKVAATDIAVTDPKAETASATIDEVEAADKKPKSKKKSDDPFAD